MTILFVTGPNQLNIVTHGLVITIKILVLSSVVINLNKSQGVAATVREFEGIRDFFTSASMVAFIDLPFMFLFLGIIYMIAGPLAIVPILIVPIVLGVAALTQPLLKRFSQRHLTSQQGKTTILHELLNNVETVRTIAGGKFLHDKWNSSVEEQSKAGTTSRAISNFAVTFSQTGLQARRHEHASARRCHH